MEKVKDSYPGFKKNDSSPPWLHLGAMHSTKAITVTRPIFRTYTEIGIIRKRKRLRGGGEGGKCLLSEKFWNGNAQYNPQNSHRLHSNQDSNLSFV